MTNIIKIGPYSPLIKNQSKYQAVVKLGLQQNDPKIIMPADLDIEKIKKQIKETDVVYTSSLKRAQGTLSFLLNSKIFDKKIKIITNNNLDEIKFDLRKLCSQEQYEKFGSDCVRKGFINSFIQDTLEEKAEMIEGKIVAILETARENELKKLHTLFISHTFFIKLLLIYQQDPAIFKNRENIKKFIKPKEKIMDFFEINYINL